MHNTLRTPAGERLAVFDVGGTDVKLGVVDGGGLGAIRRVPTPGEAGTDRSQALVDLIAAESAGATAISAAVPGIVDEARGVVTFAANLGLVECPLRDRLAAATGVPVVLGHDIAAVGLAERQFGAARDADNVLVVPIGTGIAAVAFVDGHRLSAGGYAGEIGHAQVPGGERCTCGGDSCLETVASASAIARRYFARTGRRVSGARDVLDRRGTDADANAVWREAVQALAYTLAQATSILGSELIVIGGGLAAAEGALLDPLAAELDRRLSFQRRPKLRLARLGPDAGLWGASILGVDLLRPTARSDQ